MKNFKYVFIIVVYRNGEDLYKFNESLSIIKDYKVIVVNSYLDENTKKRIESIANELNFDFLNIKNKGYGYGNNRGIEYAKSRYEYDYLIVSNADIELKEFREDTLIDNNTVIGPQIKTLTGKNQNPYQVKKSNLLAKLYYLGFKSNKGCLYIAIILNKIIRELYILFHLLFRKTYKVYAVHGAFIIFSKDVIDRLFPVYDENMFLYNEEIYLAYRLDKEKINCFVNSKIKVLHKEDGSTRGIKIDTNKYAKESFLYFFEKYYK